MKYRDIAFKIAGEAFAEKKDKAGKPYIYHLLRVEETACMLAEESGKLSDEQQIDEIRVVALLHDLIEDCEEWTVKQLRTIFGRSIADSIRRLTKKSDFKYEDYITNIHSNYMARLVKIADLRDNMDTTRLPSLNESDIERLKKYHKAYLYLTGQAQVVRNVTRNP